MSRTFTMVIAALSVQVFTSTVSGTRLGWWPVDGDWSAYPGGWYNENLQPTPPPNFDEDAYVQNGGTVTIHDSAAQCLNLNDLALM
jgi:hypothetical protein